MPKSFRTKSEVQEDRLAREMSDARAKPHPETVESAADSAEEPQIADIAPSEVDEPRRPSGPHKRREPDEDLETQLTEVSEDAGSTESPDRSHPRDSVRSTRQG